MSDPTQAHESTYCGVPTEVIVERNLDLSGVEVGILSSPCNPHLQSVGSLRLVSGIYTLLKGYNGLRCAVLYHPPDPVGIVGFRLHSCVPLRIEKP